MPHKVNEKHPDWPSVTEVVGLLDKPWLRYWYGKLGTEEAEKQAAVASERGRKFHEEIAGLVGERTKLGEWVVVGSDEVNPLVWRLRDMMFDPHHAEEPVESNLHRYYGCPDVWGDSINSATCVVDFKFTNTGSPRTALQLAGYMQAINETFPQEPKVISGVVLRVYELKTPAKESKITETAAGRKHSYKGSKFYLEEVNYYNLSEYLKVFLKLRDVWDFENERGKFERTKLD